MKVRNCARSCKLFIRLRKEAKPCTITTASFVKREGVFRDKASQKTCRYSGVIFVFGAKGEMDEGKGKFINE